MGSLFGYIDDNDEYLHVKSFFESFNSITFCSTIQALIERYDFGNEYQMCCFPENIEDGEELFEGVKFILGEYNPDIQIISDNEFKEIALEACQARLKIDKKQKKEIEILIEQLKKM